MQTIIRNELKNDERIVEEITRKAFWNLYFPGCREHYLAHLLRKSDDFIPELNLVMLENDQIIGSIMYTKSCVIDENDERLDVILEFAQLVAKRLNLLHLVVNHRDVFGDALGFIQYLLDVHRRVIDDELRAGGKRQRQGDEGGDDEFFHVFPFVGCGWFIVRCEEIAWWAGKSRRQ